MLASLINSFSQRVVTNLLFFGWGLGCRGLNLQQRIVT